MAEQTSLEFDRSRNYEGRIGGVVDGRLRDETLNSPMRSVWPEEVTSPRHWSDFGKAMAAQVLDRSGLDAGAGSVISAEEIQAIRGDPVASSAVDGELSATSRNLPPGRFELDPKAQVETSDLREEAQGPQTSHRDRMNLLGSPLLESALVEYAGPAVGTGTPTLENSDTQSTITHSGQVTSLNAAEGSASSQTTLGPSVALGLGERSMDDASPFGEFSGQARSIGSGGGQDLDVGTAGDGGLRYEAGLSGGEAGSNDLEPEGYPDARIDLPPTVGPGQLSGTSGSPSAELSGLIRMLQQLLDEMRNARRDFLPPNGREVYPAR